MGATETDTREMWRLIGAALLFAVVCGGAALAALQADAQSVVADRTQPPAAVHEQLPAAAGARGMHPPAATAAPAGSPAGSPADSPAPAVEIPDDATVAPDSRQKADNNVSFPVDI